LAIPFICVISGVATLSPSMIGGRVARGVVLPIIPGYSSNISDIKSTIKKFPQKYCRTVKGFNGITIDSADIPLESKNVQRYRIVFNAAAEIYQLFWEQIKDENNQLQCNTRVFNYPGITQNNPPGSSIDFVNAGIAQVYDLAKKMKWMNAELEKHLHFYGYCLGGGVGLQVAAYFKEKHGINFCVFVDRSFATYSEAMAGVIYAHSGVPLPLAKGIATTFLYAGGELDLDSVHAIKKLDPNCVHYINVASETPKNPESVMEQVKQFLGIGHIDTGDGILLKEVTLTAALEREGIQCGKQTSDILAALGIQNHFVHSESKTGHFGSMNALLNANNYYKNIVVAHEENLEESKMSANTNRCVS